MKVLVTGGAGHIGAHLVGALRQAGHAVRVLDLNAPSELSPPDHGYEFIQGSVADPGVVAEAVRGIHIVYHLAWGFLAARFYPEFRPEVEQREVQENLSGTLNLLEAALEAALAAGVHHLLFSSSTVVYGHTGPTRVEEEHPCHPESSTLGGAVYGITKLACERVCLVYQRRGLPVTIFRLHGVFSAGNLGQYAHMIEQALAGEPLRATRGAGGEYAHIADVVRAFLLVQDNPKACGEIFSLAGSHTYSEPTLARTIVEMADSGSPVELGTDSTQEMISVSVDKLRRLLGYEPEHGEFLTALIRRTLEGRKTACTSADPSWTLANSM